MLSIEAVIEPQPQAERILLARIAYSHIGDGMRVELYQQMQPPSESAMQYARPSSPAGVAHGFTSKRSDPRVAIRAYQAPHSILRHLLTWSFSI